MDTAAHLDQTRWSPHLWLPSCFPSHLFLFVCHFFWPIKEKSYIFLPDLSIVSGLVLKSTENNHPPKCVICIILNVKNMNRKFPQNPPIINTKIFLIVVPTAGQVSPSAVYLNRSNHW